MKGMQTRQPSKSGRHTAAKTTRGGSPKVKASTSRPTAPKKKIVAAKKAAATAKKAPTPKAAKKSAGYNPLAPERIEQILARLDQRYPEVKCALTHNSAWELLVATILSAQCTDARVNMVTPVIFAKYPSPEHFARLEPEDLEPDVKSTGFFRNKAKSIVGAARKVVSDFGGEVPNEMEKLLTIPGAARKTANVVLGSWYEIAEGVVVDTHVHRISRRLELTTENDPPKIEQDLMKIIPRDRWIAFSHQIIHHGRQLCDARKPKCEQCPLEDLCHAGDKTWSTVELNPRAEVE